MKKALWWIGGTVVVLLAVGWLWGKSLIAAAAAGANSNN